MKRFRPLIGALAALASVAAVSGTAGAGEREPPPIQVESLVTRDYGYFMGDLVEVVYVISLPPGHHLHEASLSNQARQEDPSSSEVRSRNLEPRQRGKNHAIHLAFVYQIFSAADGVQPFEIPALRFSYGPKENPAAHESSLPPVPIMMSSLTPDGALFQPPILWTWTSPSPKNIRLVGFALLLVGALPIFFGRRRTFRAYSPFKAARDQISRENDPAAALILFRRALNEKTGKAVFPHNLDDFFSAFPQARAYEKEVEEMVRLSDEMIFNPRSTRTPDGWKARISGLTAKLRKAEKWR